MVKKLATCDFTGHELMEQQGMDRWSQDPALRQTESGKKGLPNLCLPAVDWKMELEPTSSDRGPAALWKSLQHADGAALSPSHALSERWVHSGPARGGPDFSPGPHNSSPEEAILPWAVPKSLGCCLIPRVCLGSWIPWETPTVLAVRIPMPTHQCWPNGNEQKLLWIHSPIPLQTIDPWLNHAWAQNTG